VTGVPGADVHRSFLFAPGGDERKSHKALSSDADAVILDLEDAVAVSRKAAARDAVSALLSARAGARAYVRINGFDTEHCLPDIQMAAASGACGLVLPKAERPAEVVAVSWLLTGLERANGRAPGSIDLMPLIETARGLAAARQIAAADARVRRLAFGAGDYTGDLNLVWSRGESELEPARAELALASRLAGLEPPIDSVFPHVRDADGFAASAARGRALGFQGKLCIHPDQVSAANAAYSPSPDELAQARKIVAAFEASEAAGAASIEVDGFFVDYPIVERAVRTVQLADAIAARG